MRNYHELLARALRGHKKGDRTDTGTTSISGQMLKYDLDEGFPLVTTKFVSFHNVMHELLWFISGKCYSREYLREHNVKIWDDWSNAELMGELGPIYGVQWRNWRGHPNRYIGSPQPGVDQLQQCISTLRTDPDDRRMIVSSWNVEAIPAMALPPCHVLFQFISQPTGGSRHLDLVIYQRSCDLFLGVPYNIASYALLTHLVAKITNHRPGTLTWVGGDCHVYANHREQVTEQLARKHFPLPTIYIANVSEIDHYTHEDIILNDYQHHPAIKAPIAV